jgi:RND family efflux transporter MFP subunit
MNPRPLLLCLMLLAVSAAVCADDDDDKAVAATAAVQTAAVSERDLGDTLSAYGTVKAGPQRLRDVVATHAGEVTGIQVLPGQRVHAGEALLTLVAAPENVASFAQAQSADAFARSSLERTQGLFKERLATREQLADAERAASDADANLAAQQALGGDEPRSVLRAPADGVVGAIAVHAGERVAENTLLLGFEGGADSYAELDIDPEDAAQVRAGMAVILRPVFGSGAAVQATVAQVAGRVDDASGLVAVQVRLPAKAGLMSGAAVNGSIVLHTSKTLAVPRSAVLHDDDGAYVFIVKDQAAHRVNVQAGADDGAWVGVSGALHAGDQVVTLGNYELQDGMAVREGAP